MANEHETESEPVGISRRRLLQALGASGAVVAIELLAPGRWTRPSVSASPAIPTDPLIGSLAMFWQPQNSSHAQGTVRFRYYAPDSDINSSSGLYAAVINGSLFNNVPIMEAGGQVIPYTAMNGTVRFPLPYPLPFAYNEGIKLAVASASNSSHVSNTLTGYSTVKNGAVWLSELTFGHQVFNNSVASDGCGLPVASFKYNSTAANMVSATTNLYAWHNGLGWISAGGPISNASGEIMPDTPTTGEILLPILVTNSSLPFELSLFLEDTAYEYDTDPVSGIYSGCDTLQITSFDQHLCGPWVQNGRIGCRYDLMIGYQDDNGKMGPNARLSIEYDGEMLVDGQTLADLGLSVSDPTTGVLSLPVLLPQIGQNGLLHPLHAVLENEDGDKSMPAVTEVSEFCFHEFALVLNSTAAYPINNSATQWRVMGTYNDSAGLVSNTSLLSAVLNSPSDGLRTIYNAVPLGSVGRAWETNGYAYFPEALNCSALPINGSIGSLAFDLDTAIVPSRAAADETAELAWFLAEPPSRDAAAPTILLDPSVEPPPEEGAKNFVPIIRA